MMARKMTFLLILLVSLILIPIDSVEAQTTSQGLEWGVQEGDQFNYTMRMRYPDGNIDLQEPVILSIVGLGWIPDPATLFVGGGFESWIDLKWQNGSNVHENVAIDYTVLMPLPIGNWSVFTDLVEDNQELHVIDGLSNTWGFTFQDQLGIGGLTIKYTYSKNDGMIQQFREREVAPTGGETFLMEVTRVSNSQTLLLIGGIAGAGIIALVIVIYWKKK
jgi:hypothetical protein